MAGFENAWSNPASTRQAHALIEALAGLFGEAVHTAPPVPSCDPGRKAAPRWGDPGLQAAAEEWHRGQSGVTYILKDASGARALVFPYGDGLYRWCVEGAPGTEPHRLPLWAPSLPLESAQAQAAQTLAAHVQRQRHAAQPGVRWEQDGDGSMLVGLPDGLSAAVYAPSADEPGVKWRWCLAGEDARVIAADKWPGVETQQIAQQQLLDALAKYLVERVSTCMRTLDALQPERLAPLPEVPAVPAPGEERQLPLPPPKEHVVAVRLVLTTRVKVDCYGGARARQVAKTLIAHRLPAVMAEMSPPTSMEPLVVEAQRYYVESIDGKPVEE